MNPGHAAGVRGDPGEHIRVVPEVVSVEQDPDLGRADLREHGVGMGEGVDESRLLALRHMHRLEPDTDMRRPGSLRDAPQALDENLGAVGLRAVAQRPREARDALGLVRGKSPDRRAQRFDALGRVVRPFHSRDCERQDRRHLGDAHGDAKPVLMEQSGVGVVVVWQLELPEPDRIEPGRCVGLDVLGERGVDRRDLGERENHERPGSFARRRRAIGGLVSSFATR